MYNLVSRAGPRRPSSLHGGGNAGQGYYKERGVEDVRESKRNTKLARRGRAALARPPQSKYINIVLSRQRYNRLTALSRKALVDPRKFDGRSGVRGKVLDCLLTLAENHLDEFVILLMGRIDGHESSTPYERQDNHATVPTRV